MEPILRFAIPSPFQDGDWINVEFYRDRLMHIVARHVSKRDETWNELLGEEVRQRLTDFGCCQPTQQATDLLELSERLEQELRFGFDLSYVAERRFLGSGHLDREVCFAHTPGGLRVVLHRTDQGLSVWTAFYPRPGLLRGVLSKRRWEPVMRRYLRQLFKGDSRPVEELPLDAIRVRRERSGTYLTQIRFRRWENWQRGRGPEGNPWRGPLNLAERFRLDGR